MEILGILLATIAVFLVPEILYELLYFRKTEYARMTHHRFIEVLFRPGMYCEYRIYKDLGQFEKLGWKVLCNVYLPTQKGETSEVDLILLGTTGVFCLESKDYGGWIFGSEDNTYWTQCLRSKGKKSQKNRFYNPVKQNRTHVRNLGQLIGKEHGIGSIVVFSNRSDFKHLDYHSNDVRVIHRRELIPLLKSTIKQKEPIYSIEQIEKLYQQLYPHTQVDKATKNKHVTRIKEKYQK